jgi:alpha-beta hydrolase superfamily lysophospholipase
MPYFAERGYASHALSLRGHGGSEGHSRLRWTSLADYVTDVAQVASQMDRPPVLVGHSMGGMTVQKYLESHPAPAAVLLASAPPRGVLPATLKVLVRHPIVFLKVNLTMRLAPVVATPDLAREALFTAEIPTEELNRHFARLQNDSYRAYLDMLLLNLPRPKRVSTPILVLGAANDFLFSPAEVEATARAYGTQAEIFPAMAHDMMLEPGWQAVADRILAWLDAQGL